MVLQLLVTSCSCYNNNCIPTFLAHDITFSVYKWFSWHCSLYSHKILSTVFNVILIIINSYEHFKLIESNTQLNPFESFRTHCSSDSYVSYHITSFLLSALWLTGSVKIRYLRHEVAANWLCGRAVTGINPIISEFSVACWYFEVEVAMN